MGVRHTTWRNRIACAAAACIALSGCTMQPPGGADTAAGDAPAPSTGKPVIGVAAIDLTSPFFVGMRKAADVAAEDYGVATTWQSAEGSVENQISTIQNFINQGVAAILVDPLDKNALGTVIKRAEAAGIPVVSMGNKIDAEGAYNTLYRDADNMATVARASATALGGEGEIALLVGARGNYVSDTREKAFRTTLREEYPDIDLVSVQPTAFDSRKASNTTVTWMTTDPDLDLVACISDPLCLSAKTTASSLGRADLRVAGHDGDADMHGLLADGSMVVDVLTGAGRVGYWNLAVGARLADGADLPRELYLPSYVVSTDRTAEELRGKGLDLDYATPEEAAAIAEDYGDEFGPGLDDADMTVRP
ncbi:monosaccharide ABC transporter substrate-binding protein (CUT2 family) [Murinocardiopsis flavida]|uniref:Monosaccharide ABC transporter substrate-binding protein (CUT2 family) n=1 Tax=Murinocardiopsis flavida TaxID=645275 RepID=A0A2P8CXJ3_9ACTN|nr:sugar ABC transporter substrate-binding protein [Murinocardiopsis flavida]PSK89688.1 monosaccharide ABC transporter substrate-binding protein (CUT2 family) [Murinocardiopsis flavida]